MILAIDTSLAALSIALVDRGSVVGAFQLQSEGSRNEKLLPAVDWLLGECAVRLEDVELLAATRGPGSFTGVRVGLATIQGMALARDTRVCGMVTHHALAFMHPASRVLVHSDAGRGEFYVAGYAATQSLLEPCLFSAEQLEATKGEYEEVIDLTAAADRYNVAVWCGLGAAEIVGRGDLDRFSDLTPVYVRLAEAEVKLLEKQGE
jgi:tRNA threonylcarbamoyladenosine biosynthesis protein TsaB